MDTLLKESVVNPGRGKRVPPASFFKKKGGGVGCLRGAGGNGVRRLGGGSDTGWPWAR